MKLTSLIAAIIVTITLFGCADIRPSAPNDAGMSGLKKPAMADSDRQAPSATCKELHDSVKFYSRSQYYERVELAKDDPASVKIAAQLRRFEKIEQNILSAVARLDRENNDFKSSVCLQVMDMFEIVSRIASDYYREVDNEALLYSLIDGFHPLTATKSHEISQTENKSGNKANLSTEQIADLFVSTLLTARQSHDSWRMDSAANAAVDHMIASLDDTSKVLRPEGFNLLQKSASGDLGIHVSEKEGEFFVSFVTIVSDQLRQLVHIGDQLLDIDGVPMAGKLRFEVYQALRGEVGTAATLTLFRDRRQLQVKLQRQPIAGSELLVKRINPDVVYVLIAEFQNQTPTHLQQAIEDQLKSSTTALNGLIFDLRGNPGGVLSAAVEIADFFIAQGNIVTIQGRNRGNTMNFEASPKILDKLANAKIAVLVDMDSASGVTILANALRHYRQAIIIGTPPHPKGLIETIIPLRKKSTALRLATAVIALSGMAASPVLNLRPDYCSRLNQQTHQLDFFAQQPVDNNCERARFPDNDLRQQEIEFARALVQKRANDR